MKGIFQQVISVHYKLLRLLVKGIASILFLPARPQHVKKLLIVRKGRLGDHICSLPAIDSIRNRFNVAEIHLLTQTRNAPELGIEALVPEGYFTHIFDYGDYKGSSLMKQLKQQKYDAVIEIPQNVDTLYTQLRNMIVFRFVAGIKSGAGWAVSQTRFLKSYQLKRIFPNEQDRISEILGSYGLNVNSEHYPFKKVATSLVPENRNKNVAIAPGANIERKVWPFSRYMEVAEWLMTQGYNIVLVGDEKDNAFVKGHDVSGMINLMGKLSVAESIDVLKKCRFTISNDSGPMHLSYASGTPVVALFSARAYKGKWNPPADGKNIVLSDYSVACSGCINDPCASNICLQHISVQTVLTYIGALIKATEI